MQMIVEYPWTFALTAFYIMAVLRGGSYVFGIEKDMTFFSRVSWSLFGGPALIILMPIVSFFILPMMMERAIKGTR